MTTYNIAYIMSRENGRIRIIIEDLISDIDEKLKNAKIPDTDKDKINTNLSKIEGLKFMRSYHTLFRKITDTYKKKFSLPAYYELHPSTYCTIISFLMFHYLGKYALCNLRLNDANQKIVSLATPLPKDVRDLIVEQLALEGGKKYKLKKRRRKTLKKK